MFECRRKRDPSVGDFCALEHSGYCKVEMLWAVTRSNTITGNNTSGVCVCVNHTSVVRLVTALIQFTNQTTCPAHCSGLCAIPTSVNHLPIRIKGELLLFCLMLKKWRWAVLCVYPGFPSLALSLKPLLGSVMSQQGLVCSAFLPCRSWRVTPLVVWWCLDFRGVVSTQKNKPWTHQSKQKFPITEAEKAQ